MSSKRLWAGAVLALALQATASHAAVTLWDNGPGPALSGAGSNMSGWNQAADFNLSFASTLSSVSFWSLEAAGAYTGSITYRIVGSSGGSPDDASIFASGTVSPTRLPAGAASGLSVFQNTFAIASGPLAIGTYWLELHNGTSLADANESLEFYWSDADGNATNLASIRDQEFTLPADGSGWTTNDTEHAFFIEGDRVIQPPPGVPEPATILLAAMAIGLARRAGCRRA